MNISFKYDLAKEEIIRANDICDQIIAVIRKDFYPNSDVYITITKSRYLAINTIMELARIIDLCAEMDDMVISSIDIPDDDRHHTIEYTQSSLPEIRDRLYEAIIDGMSDMPPSRFVIERTTKKDGIKWVYDASPPACWREIEKVENDTIYLTGRSTKEEPHTYLVYSDYDLEEEWVKKREIPPDYDFFTHTSRRNIAGHSFLTYLVTSLHNVDRICKIMRNGGAVSFLPDYNIIVEGDNDNAVPLLAQDPPPEFRMDFPS